MQINVMNQTDKTIKLDVSSMDQNKLQPVTKKSPGKKSKKENKKPSKNLFTDSFLGSFLALFF